MRVALVVMPFAAATRPSLAVGLLQAAVQRRGIACDAKYFNLTLEHLLGAEAYRYLAEDAPMTALVGEWAFSQLFYGQRFSDWDSYRAQVLEGSGDPLPEDARRHVLRLLEIAPTFLRLAFESNDWGRYALVGFTSTFAQTMPALCLARLIRAHHPEVLLAAGGANFEREMGRPYMEHFEFLDFVATGEADRSFPELCGRLREVRAGRCEHLRVPPGFLYRHDGGVRSSPPSAGERVVLDDLPTPSYDDYFRVARLTGGRDPSRQWLPVEASRGCWWGEKAHCTFCGLNGEAMAFRRKSWRRVVAETDELTARYGVTRLQFTDNILAMSYFSDLLPFWAERGDAVEKYFEIKSNLRREQVELLRACGVTTIQAGVESLADRTLRLMRKGVTAAQNVALLRWCCEVGIKPLWNVIYAFPGEDPDDCRQTLAVLRKITHLPPPTVCAPIRLDRFSPHHEHWRRFGLRAVAPVGAYRHVFAFSAADRERMACYFVADHPGREAVVAAGAALGELGRVWRARLARGENGELAVRPDGQGGLELLDTRFNFAPSRRRLTSAETALLVACDRPAPAPRALRRAAERVPAADLERALAGLIAESVIARLGPRLITLALLPPREQLKPRSGLNYGSDRWPLPADPGDSAH